MRGGADPRYLDEHAGPRMAETRNDEERDFRISGGYQISSEGRNRAVRASLRPGFSAGSREARKIALSLSQAASASVLRTSCGG